MTKAEKSRCREGVPAGLRELCRDGRLIACTGGYPNSHQSVVDHMVQQISATHCIEFVNREFANFVVQIAHVIPRFFGGAIPSCTVDAATWEAVHWPCDARHHCSDGLERVSFGQRLSAVSDAVLPAAKQTDDKHD
jgi:hypothetical protein